MFLNFNVNNNNTPKKNESWLPSFDFTIFDKNGFLNFSYKAKDPAEEAFDNLYDAMVNSPRDAEFWLMHPVARGIGVGMMTKIFNRAINSPTAFRMGFMYGLFSGIANVAERPLIEKVAEMNNPGMKAISVIALSTLPWVASYHVMHKCLAKSGRSYFHITTGPAVATAIAIQFFGWAHADLFWKKSV